MQCPSKVAQSKTFLKQHDMLQGYNLSPKISNAMCNVINHIKYTKLQQSSCKNVLYNSTNKAIIIIITTEK